jgi:hypothetical protein
MAALAFHLVYFSGLTADDILGCVVSLLASLLLYNALATDPLTDRPGRLQGGPAPWPRKPSTRRARPGHGPQTGLKSITRPSGLGRNIQTKHAI